MNEWILAKRPFKLGVQSSGSEILNYIVKLNHFNYVDQIFLTGSYSSLK